MKFNTKKDKACENEIYRCFLHSSTYQVASLNPGDIENMFAVPSILSVQSFSGNSISDILSSFDLDYFDADKSSKALMNIVVKEGEKIRHYDFSSITDFLSRFPSSCDVRFGFSTKEDMESEFCVYLATTYEKACEWY